MMRIVKKMKIGNDSECHCSNCDYCHFDKNYDDWFCNNKEHVYYGEPVTFRHTCEDWKRRKTLDDLKSGYKRMRNSSRG